MKKGMLYAFLGVFAVVLVVVLSVMAVRFIDGRNKPTKDSQVEILQKERDALKQQLADALQKERDDLKQQLADAQQKKPVVSKPEVVSPKKESVDGFTQYEAKLAKLYEEKESALREKEKALQEKEAALNSKPKVEESKKISSNLEMEKLMEEQRTYENDPSQENAFVECLKNVFRFPDRLAGKCARLTKKQFKGMGLLQDRDASDINEAFRQARRALVANIPKKAVELYEPDDPTLTAEQEAAERAAKERDNQAKTVLKVQAFLESFIQSYQAADEKVTAKEEKKIRKKAVKAGKSAVKERS